MGIPNIPRVQIYNQGIPYVHAWQVTQPYVPDFYPVTNHMGFPIVDIPGCVKMHKDNKRHKNGVPIDKNFI